MNRNAAALAVSPLARPLTGYDRTKRRLATRQPLLVRAVSSTSCLAGLAALLVNGALASTAAAQTQIQYIGTSGGNWADPANWSIYLTPANSATRTFAVYIPRSTAVYFDMPGATTLSSLYVERDGNSSVNLQPSTDLTVTGRTFGHIYGYNAKFASTANTITGLTDAHLHAYDGSKFVVAGRSLSFTSDYFGDVEILGAAGAASELNLSTVTALTYRDGWYRTTKSINASGGGKINLSGLQTINQPSDQDDILAINVNTGGSIDLSALQSILPAYSNTNARVRFNPGAGSTIALPVLDNANGIEFDPDAGGSVSAPLLKRVTYSFFTGADGSTTNLPALTGLYRTELAVSPTRTINVGTLTEIDGSRISVSGGAVFDKAADPHIQLDWHNGDTAVFSATGAGSVLNLSPTKEMTVGDDRFRSLVRISATGGGQVNLSGLETIHQRSGQDDQLDFVLNSGGSIKLDKLNTIFPNYNNESSRVRFYPSNGSNLVLPALTSARGLELRPSGGASIDAKALSTLEYGYIEAPAGTSLDLSGLRSMTRTEAYITGTQQVAMGALTDIDGSRIRVSGGGTFDAVADADVALNYHNGDVPLFSAEGAGSVLNLSGVTKMTVGMTSYRARDLVLAGGGGKIDLSALTSIEQLSGQDDYLDFSINSGGTIDLSKLQTIYPSYNNTNARVRLFAGTGSTLSLPKLTSASGLELSPSTGGTVSAPLLASLDYGYFGLADDSDVNVPALTSMTRTELFVSNNRRVNIGSLAAIDGSRIQVSGGATFDRVADPHVFANYHGGDSPMFSAAGTGSVLDLRSVTQLTSGYENGRIRNIISATGAGTVDLSNLQTVHELAGQDDLLDFVVNSGGTLKLNKLESIFPAYTNENARTRLFVGSGSALSLPALSNANGVDFYVEANASVTAPLLTTLRHSDFSVTADDSNVSVPALSNLINSSLYISNRRTVTTGDLQQVDGSRIAIWGGVTFNKVKDAAIDMNYMYDNVLYASDAGTSLDLRSVKVINNINNRSHMNVLATQGAKIDLSGLTQITSPNFGYDLNFTADAGGVIDLSGLTQLATHNNGYYVRFGTSRGGKLTVGAPPTFMGYSSVSADGTGSRTTVTGSAYFERNAVFSPSNGGTIEIKGGLIHEMTDEGRWSNTGIVNLSGVGTFGFEVAGADGGAAAPTNGSNFGIGQLIIGGDSTASTITLQDLIDNGNRNGTKKEALYLYGLGGPQGLVMKNGSSLVISDLNVYTVQNGAWISLQDLLGTASVVPYTFGGSDGFIMRSPQAASLMWASSAGGAWAELSNWDGDVLPNASHDVVIDLQSGGTVSGPAGTQTIHSVRVNSLTNDVARLSLTDPAGDLRVAGDLNVGSHGELFVGAGSVSAVNLINQNSVVQSAGTQVRVGSVTNSGVYTVGGSLAVDQTLINNGSLNIQGGHVTARSVSGEGDTSVRRFSSLTVSSGVIQQSQLNVAGELRLQGGPGTSRVRGLTVTADGLLDLGQQSLVVDYTGPSPAAGLSAALRAGQSSAGANGITSSAATEFGWQGRWGVAMVEAGQLSASQRQGLGVADVDETSLILCAAMLGDVTLDMKVDFSDLLILARNYGKTQGATWLTGDNTFDAAVDFTDLLNLARNYGVNKPLPQGAGFSNAFASDFALAQSMVAPEPAGLLAALGLAAVAARRRRAGSLSQR